jgi:hypothetical protein
MAAIITIMCIPTLDLANHRALAAFLPRPSEVATRIRSPRYTHDCYLRFPPFPHMGGNKISPNGRPSELGRRVCGIEVLMSLCIRMNIICGTIRGNVSSDGGQPIYNIMIGGWRMFRLPARWHMILVSTFCHSLPHILCSSCPLITTGDPKEDFLHGGSNFDFDGLVKCKA